MINYESGFVRRGISGEIIIYLERFFPPHVSIFLIVACCYILIFFYIFIFARPIIRRVEIALCFLSPLGLFFPVYDSRSAGRKEIVILALFAAQLFLVRQNSIAQKYQLLAVVLTWGLFFFFWEGAYFFIGFPLAIMFFSLGATHGQRSGFLTTVAAAFALTIVFAIIAVLTMKGVSAQQVAVMCDALGVAAPDHCTQEWSIAYLASNVSGALREVAQMAANGAIWFYFVAACLGFLPILLVLHLYEFNTAAGRNGYLLILALMAANVFVAPLFLFALDWGRWLNIMYLFTFMSILFFINIGWLRLQTSDRGPYAELDDRSVLRTPLLPIFIVAVLLYSVSWSVPVCCASNFGKGLLGLSERTLKLPQVEFGAR